MTERLTGERRAAGRPAGEPTEPPAGDGRTGLWAPVRPQPLGAFPLPLGLLLVPGGPDTEESRRTLVAGRVPERWPAALRAHELAWAGDVAGALAALTGDDPVTRYNRFVLDPDGTDPAALRAELGEEFGVLVDVVSFTLGRTDTPPRLGAADGELAALVLAAQATHAVDRGDPDTALRLLEQATAPAVAPPLAGVLLGAAAGIRKDAHGPGPQVVETLRRALDLLRDTDLRIGRAELHLTLALTLHELAGDRRDLLAQAVKHYHSTLQAVTSAEAPEVWAAAHANLATAYLTMPMAQASDQLRLGVAIRSLRAALQVYTPQRHPDRWASAQLNLANALVYAPSRHQADNLVEAVELYEAVLEARPRERDPLGRARVLANQGNVLAHLGMFDQAKAKLHEARFLFEEFQDGESVRAVRGVLDEIARHAALTRTAPAAAQAGVQDVMQDEARTGTQG